MHYPTKAYKTYADCDQDFVRKSLPSDLVPFWNVDNISQATSFWAGENKKMRQSAVANSGSKNFKKITFYNLKDQINFRDLYVWTKIISLQGILCFYVGIFLVTHQ